MIHTFKGLLYVNIFLIDDILICSFKVIAIVFVYSFSVKYVQKICVYNFAINLLSLE